MDHLAIIFTYFQHTFFMTTPVDKNQTEAIFVWIRDISVAEDL